MANISAIKLPNNTTYIIKDNGALQLTGGQVTGPVTFGNSVSIDEATVGDLVVNGSASFTNNLQANTINGVTVGSNPKFTDTNTVTTATTTGSGNAVTAITASNGALTVTKGTTFLTSHQDISGKADKATTLAGYGITDAKIASGVITLGSNTITPLTSSSTLSASKLSGAIPSAVTATTQASTDNSTKIATTAYVTTAIANLPEPMVFKGSVGTGGTITSLPTAAASNEGYTYKVITALSSPSAKVGDTVISNGSSWVVIPSGDEPSGTVTSVGISNGGGLSVSGSPITSSGTITIGHSNSVTAQTTQAVYPIKIDAQGHISAYGSAQTILSIGTTSSTAAAGNHTHDIGLGSTTDTTSGVTLASATKYKLTAGGKSVYFTMPTIPTVNNATLTIQKNGTTVNSFTANASSNVTANITVPTKTSELTNDSGYITNAGVTGVKGNSESSYRTGQVNLTAANIGATSTSVLPNDNGEIKTKFRVANKGYTGSGNPIWYYPLAKLPVDNSSNYASLIISGRIGGWVSENMSSIQALVWNRNSTGIALFDIAGTATAMSSIWGICDIVCYTNDDGTDTVYLMAKSYFTYDLDLELYQGAASFLYDGTYSTTTPTGTLVAQASTSTKRVELVNGKFLVGGTDLSVVSNLSGTLAVEHGGTGQTTAANAINALLGGLPVWTADPTDTTYFVRQDTGGSASYGKVAFSTIWNYISGKLPAWSKASTKPTYTASEVGALASNTTYVSTITTTAGTHSAISSKSGAVSFNVPTKTSHLTNDSGFITASHTSTYSLPLAADGTRGGVQIGYSESGTNYAVKLSSEKMYVTVPWTDTKVTTAALKSGTTYYPILATGTGTATRQIDSTLGGLKYVSTAGTTSAIGTATLCLGNATGSGTANNERGVLRLYSSNATYYTDLKSTSADSIKTITFPNATGTVALTSDIPTVPSNIVNTITTTAGAHTAISSKSGAVSFNVPTTAAHVGAATSDHTHGNITNGGDITATAPTIVSGDQIIINDDSASKITNGPTFDGSTTTKALSQKGTWETFSNSLLYGTCSTAAATVAKTVTVNSSFKLVTGATVAVKFSNTNTADAPTLNVNSTGAKALMRKDSTYAGTSSHTSWVAGETVPLLYDGSHWLIMNNMAQNNYVTQSYNSSNTDYNLALSAYTSTNGGATTLNHSNKIKGNPSTGRITTADLSSSDIDAFVDSLNYSQINAVDYIIEQEMYDSGWSYTKWNSGKLECWYKANPGSYTCGTARGNWYSGGDLTFTFPVAFTTIPSITGSVSLGTSAYVVMLQFNGNTTTSCQGRIVAGSSITANSNYWIYIHAIGRWK